MSLSTSTKIKHCLSGHVVFWYANIMSPSKSILSCEALQMFSDVHYQRQYSDTYIFFMCVFAFLYHYFIEINY